MRRWLRRALKDWLTHTRFAPLLLYRASTTFRPSQLAFLLDCVARAAKVEGTFVEVGCFEGATTIWLNHHLDDIGADPRYVAIDTFRGFLESDVAHEVASRGRAADAALYSVAFTDNDRAWVARTLALNGVRRVELIEADANHFDYAPLGPVAFALIDVDLYRPVLCALEALWPQLVVGGVIVVDDCDDTVTVWDGALQAYREFCARHGLAPRIAHRKLGLIAKTAH